MDEWNADFKEWKKSNSGSEVDYEQVKQKPLNANDGKVIANIKKLSDKYYEIEIGNQTCLAEYKTVNVPDYSKDVAQGVDEDSETEGETAKEKEISGFVVSYYYFIRHNYDSTTHVLGETGPMQFAVVRNNIYKLSVTSLNGLPVPYDPSDPDEPQNAYISVELKVLAWAKRDITVSW